MFMFKKWLWTVSMTGKLFSYLSRPQSTINLRTNPGLRHTSRLYTIRHSFICPKDPFPEGQIKYVSNGFNSDGQSSALLVDCMNLFSRQLPNMGTIYISRLVFDVEAFCVSLIHEGRAHGAICVRIFKKEEFIEISFCAVDYEYQSRGYGRLLMDFLKCYVQNIGIFDIITCADNEAVTYFQKQGFNKHEILMDLKDG